MPPGRDRLGRAHQLRVDIAIAFSMSPAWLRRALGDRDAAKARSARLEIVERIAQAIEKRFRITWTGQEDEGENARPLDQAQPLFGGPAMARPNVQARVDPPQSEEHKENNKADRVVEQP